MQGYQERDYSDIINLPHHVSKKHPQMPLLDRAAQFSPFAALTGHEDAIHETARLVEEKLVLDENEKAILDGTLQEIKAHLSEHPNVSVMYFKPDAVKQGGSYERVSGRVRKLDEYASKLILENGVEIIFENMVQIELIEK